MTYKITINGTVQGVGFRPFVYTLAYRQGLFGSVSNGTQGVEIFLACSSEELQLFLDSLRDELPPLAQIDTLHIDETTKQSFTKFEIVASDESGKKTVRIPPDITICKACEEELIDPENRRYNYPFITCTHCGVRYSIIKELPYDRKYTTMAKFPMCQECQDEYTNPLDRRYHAQPIGCHKCGPELTLLDKQGMRIDSSEMIDQVVSYLLDGHIVAIKGVGGYHLTCDATNDKAVKRLRERKQRPTKPFAVMVKDIQMAEEMATINPIEREYLTSKERPIVLLKAHKNTKRYSRFVTPHISTIGLFLPYTPLHLLLLERLNRPLVATSANITDEPICRDRESIEKLQYIYDYLLDHNREIYNGCDDSLLFIVEDKPVLLRRARGYAPVSIKLPFVLEQNILALGANQKNTIAIAFEDQVILSPYIGDLDTIESVEYFEKNIKTLERIYEFTPDIVKHDLHPNYESSKYALHHYENRVEVQHHYAHILSTMAEQQITSRVLGVAFDGTGYGDDGNLWGGEFMLCDYEGYERVVHIKYFKLLGGSRAIKEPKRVALGLLFDIYGKDAMSLDNPTIKAFSSFELQTLYTLWEKGLNAPLSSSVGRLFDAVASLVGVCQVMSFEAESGMLLEEIYDASVQGYYPFGYSDGEIDVYPVFREILAEESSSIAVSRFFHSVVEMIVLLHSHYPKIPLLLSGGVFQNRVLLELIFAKIPEAIISQRVVPNDGGISLGQIVAYSTQI